MQSDHTLASLLLGASRRLYDEVETNGYQMSERERDAVTAAVRALEFLFDKPDKGN